ncbi:hypothetical protein Taro_046577, partial [Colocasia esculenta]|nr:hypothetical protein [Colocasia esculenta]
MRQDTPPLGAPPPSMAKPSAKLLFPILSLSFLSLLALLLVPFARPPPPRPLGFSRVRYLDDHSPPAPRIAYLILGSDGDGDRVLRLLRAVYHPGNWYLLHLDLRAPQRQREELASAVQAVDAFRAAGNVNVVGKAGYANCEGSTAITAVLHGAAILLRHSKEWDWFVNLAASDYPLITQDGNVWFTSSSCLIRYPRFNFKSINFLHVLSFVPRDLNFIQHTGDIGWKESRRVLSIIVDPGLYLAARRDIFHGSQKRPLPTAYKFFTGSILIAIATL